MVHAFYCWRIRILGGHWGIIVVVIIISTYQCVMVSISGFGVGFIANFLLVDYVDSMLTLPIRCLKTGSEFLEQALTR